MRRLVPTIVFLVVLAAPIQTQVPEGVVPEKTDFGTDWVAEIEDWSFIRRIQARLQVLGYDAGPKDGVLGWQTVAAIRTFEADNGLSNEELDPKALDELAMRLYGSLPEFNEGVAAYKRGDYATALRVWRIHAARGDAHAQYNLGAMYDEGKGVPQDYAKAIQWYRFSVEQGFANAQYNLGALNYRGEGVPQDDVMAHKWFSLAAAQGVEAARKHRDIVAEKMTPADISKAQKLAREWLEKHGQ